MLFKTTAPDFQHHKTELAALDGLRGLAALYVLLHHARWLLSQPYAEYLKHRDQYGIVDKALVYITSGFRFGHEAVILFFVLSGFVIHLKQARSIPPQNTFKVFKIGSYFVKRTLRIYPTLILSLLITWALDFLLYNINAQPLLTPGVYTVSSFLENFFLIPAGHIWGSNGPMWSLKHEWFFYLVYPLLLFSDGIKPVIPIIICLVLFATYTFNLVQTPYIDQAAYTLLIWWTGAWLAKAYVKKSWLLIVFIILAIPGLIMSVTIVYGPFHDLACGFVFTGLIAFILSNKWQSLNTFIIRFSFFGYFSYSIYILHFPFLIFFQGVIIKYNHQLPYHLWFIPGASLLILPVIYILYLLVEKPFLSIKSSVFK